MNIITFLKCSRIKLHYKCNCLKLSCQEKWETVSPRSNTQEKHALKHWEKKIKTKCDFWNELFYIPTKLLNNTAIFECVGENINASALSVLFISILSLFKFESAQRNLMHCVWLSVVKRSWDKHSQCFFLELYYYTVWYGVFFHMTHWMFLLLESKYKMLRYLTSIFVTHKNMLELKFNL